jgi:hypothetical protein
VILHQMPFKGDILSGPLSGLDNPKIPVLYIIGNSSDLVQFNRLKAGIYITSGKSQSDDAQPLINNEFALFTLSDETIRIINDFPPLSCPYGDYKIANSATPLFFQKIGKVATRKPLILFNQTSEIKTGVICGEGIWRWKLNNWLQAGNHQAFNELTSKIIQYLSIKADKSFFRVKCKNRFMENEQVQFDAEVYNDSYELINNPDVHLTITDAAGKKYNYTFNKTSAAYHLNAGIFPVGDYRYSAQVKISNKVLQENGEFTVSILNAESLNLIADHSLLNALASRHKGKMIYPVQMDQLAQIIRERDDIKSVSYTQKKFSDIINLFWVFILIVTLLSIEWFLRKRGGAY